jgi:hypothetical protein
MKTYLYLGFACTAAFLTGCGTAEDSAWTTGVSSADARAVGRLVAAAHPGCKILSYDHDDADTIYCNTSCALYRARRTRSGWKLDPREVLLVT